MDYKTTTDECLYDSLDKDDVLVAKHPGFEDDKETKEDDIMGTVYLAGDILSEGARMRRSWEAEQLRSLGATLHVPHEDKSINDKANAVQEGLAERIVANDTKGLIESDVVIIDAHENGKGTLVELGQLKGMRDMAKIIKDELETYYFSEVSELYDIVNEVLSKKIYAHNTDIRRANTSPQSGDRREYAPNQYVYGTVLDLTDGVGFREWDEIVEAIKDE